MVVDTIIKEGGDRTFAFVLAVESAHPVDTIKKQHGLSAATEKSGTSTPPTV